MSSTFLFYSHEYQSLSLSSNFPVWVRDGRRYSTGLTSSWIFLSLRSLLREICLVIDSTLPTIVLVIISGHVRTSNRVSQLLRQRSGKSALSQRQQQQSAECSLRYEAASQGQPCSAARLWWVVVFSKARLHWTDTILGGLWGSNCSCFLWLLNKTMFSKRHRGCYMTFQHTYLIS